MKRRWVWFLIAVFGAAAGCDSGASSGDRVLVDKCQYGSGLKEPSRFDVVVFKYPNEPIKNNVPRNYIKRLLGLPGEILAIFFGRIFRFPNGAPLFKDNPIDVNADPKDLWTKGHMHVNELEIQRLFAQGRFEIVRKPPQVMLALRRIVYDNDFQAKDLAAFPRWEPAKKSAWEADKQHGFYVASVSDDQVDWLRYQHRVRIENAPPAARRELISDMMGYNSFRSVVVHRERDDWANAKGEDRTPSPNWAGDLMLECQVQAKKGEGEFWLELSRGIHRFRARWDLATGMCTLFQEEYRETELGGVKNIAAVKQVQLDSKPTKLRGPGNYQVRFANFDARLTVWVDRELPFGEGKDYPPPEIRNQDDPPDLDETAIIARRGPTLNDFEPASIGSKAAAVEVRGLRLWRNTYYTGSARDSADVPGIEFHEPTSWANFRSLKPMTMYVQQGHFLCLGDNSQASSDGREWGLVPERLMLGRALAIYFPFQRAGLIH